MKYYWNISFISAFLEVLVSWVQNPKIIWWYDISYGTYKNMNFSESIIGIDHYEFKYFTFYIIPSSCFWWNLLVNWSLFPFLYTWLFLLPKSKLVEKLHESVLVPFFLLFFSWLPPSSWTLPPPHVGAVCSRPESLWPGIGTHSYNDWSSRHSYYNYCAAGWDVPVGASADGMPTLPTGHHHTN